MANAEVLDWGCPWRKLRETFFTTKMNREATVNREKEQASGAPFHGQQCLQQVVLQFPPQEGGGGLYQPQQTLWPLRPSVSFMEKWKCSPWFHSQSQCWATNTQHSAAIATSPSRGLTSLRSSKATGSRTQWNGTHCCVSTLCYPSCSILRT